MEFLCRSTGLSRNHVLNRKGSLYTLICYSFCTRNAFSTNAKNTLLNKSYSYFVNPAGNNDLTVEFNVGRESVNYRREPPPPYSPRDGDTTDSQPPSIIHQTIIVQAPLKNSPMFYICPRCRQRVLTKVTYVSSKGTHMLAGFICGLTLWCLLCCLAALPYYCHTFKKAEHYCPNCDELLGTYSKI